MVECGADETAGKVNKDEEDAAVAAVVLFVENFGVAEGGNLKVRGQRDVGDNGFDGLLTIAPVIIVVLSSAMPTPMARLTWPDCAKDSNPTTARALGPVPSLGGPDRSTNAEASTSMAWKKVVRISQPRLRVLT